MIEGDKINKSESKWIAKILNIQILHNKGFNFKQDGKEFIARIQIRELTKLVGYRSHMNPGMSMNFRWVRDTDANKHLLTNYLIKQVILKRLACAVNHQYSPCCHCFTRKKPKKGEGHKGIIKDSLLLLLGEEEKSKALEYKKELRSQNRSLTKKEFRRILTVPLLAYFKNRVSLTKVAAFIRSLPRRDGCFRFPMIKHAPLIFCPGPCPISESKKSLSFKVDLVSNDPAINHHVRLPLSPSLSPRRGRTRFTKKSVKNGKKLKIEERTGKKINNLEKNVGTSAVSSQGQSPLILTESECSSEKSQICKNEALLSNSASLKPPLTETVSCKDNDNNLDPSFDLSCFKGTKSTLIIQIAEPLAPQSHCLEEKDSSDQTKVTVNNQAPPPTQFSPNTNKRAFCGAVCVNKRSVLGKRCKASSGKVSSSVIGVSGLAEEDEEMVEDKENRIDGNQKRILNLEKLRSLKKEIAELDKKILRSLIGSHRRKRRMKGYLGPK